MNSHAIQVIDALGGTAEVARMFEVRMPSVSDWKREGIPSARMMYLRAAHQEALAGIDLNAACASKRVAISKPSIVANKPSLDIAGGVNA